MVALTITIGALLVLVLLIAAVRSLRRASTRIDTILAEELERKDEDGLH